MPGSEVPSATPRPPQWRALLIGSLLVPPVFYFAEYGQIITQSFCFGGTQPHMSAVFPLAVLAGLTAGLGAIWRRLRLHRSELLIIYIMITVTTSLGAGLLVYIVSALPARHYYATAENDWETLFEHTPEWLTVTAPKAIEGFYEGTGTMWSVETLQAWAVPLGFWLVFALLLVLGTLALVNLVSEQWVRRERLVFPLVQVPLAVVGARGYGQFWSNRLMWLGFGISATLESINYINWLHPAFPRVWLKARPVAANITDMPLAAIRPLYASFYPWLIGLGFLLSTETSLSCWLFYWVGRVGRVLCAALGLGGSGTGRGITQLPLTDQQGTGALLTLMVVALMVAWPNLRASLRSQRPEGVQVISSHASLVILGIAFAGLVAMSSAAGLPVAIAALFFVLRWLMALAWGRVSAEAGCGFIWHHIANIHTVVAGAVGTAHLSPQALPIFAMLQPFDHYTDPRSIQLLGGFKLSEAAGIPRHQLRNALFIAIGIALIWCAWTHLHVGYTYGATTPVVRPWFTRTGRSVWNNLEGWLIAPQGTNWWEIGGYLFGGGVVLLLTAARRSIPAWPLHPIGYALGNVASMSYAWMPFLIAWLIKSAVLRYGGVKVYQRLVPLFIGLVLGSFIIAGLWGVYGAVVRQQMYLFYPH